jgi:predicted DNA-binding ribbon-helix-helix protein
MKYQRRGEDLVLVSMRFPSRLWKRLRQHAARDNTTATVILAKLAEEYLAKKSTVKKRRATNGLR